MFAALLSLLLTAEPAPYGVIHVFEIPATVLPRPEAAIQPTDRRASSVWREPAANAGVSTKIHAPMFQGGELDSKSDWEGSIPSAYAQQAERRLRPDYAGSSPAASSLFFGSSCCGPKKQGVPTDCLRVKAVPGCVVATADRPAVFAAPTEPDDAWEGLRLLLWLIFQVGFLGWRYRI